MSLENVQYIIFDLNGTLVVENYLRHDEILERLLKHRRRGRRLTVEDLREVSKGECPLSEVIGKLYAVNDPEAVSRQYLKIQVSRITFRGEALAVLKALYGKYELILCSDTTGIAKGVVKKLNLSKYFVKIFYSCDVHYLKSEEGFWAILQSNYPKAKPQQFLVVGDNPRADTYHPKRLGMHTIQVENPVNQPLDYREPSIGSDEEKPEHMIKSLAELVPLLSL